MKVSKILTSQNIRALFFIFFNLSNVESRNHFIINVAYRKSSKTTMELTDEIVGKNNELMSEFTGLSFIYKGRKHRCVLENDMALTRNELLEQVFRKIQHLRFYTEDEDFEEALFMGLFGFRGSIDLSRKLYSVDLLKSNISEKYLTNLSSLLISSSGLNQLNLNFRELQPEFVQNIKKRNPQVRINLRWFFEKYYVSLGKINIYKQQTLQDNEKLIKSFNISNNISNNFIERLFFYRNKIVNNPIDLENLSEEQKEIEIEKLRDKLAFETQSNDHEDGIRNQNIVNIARAYLPDECASCKDYHELSTRTFLRRNTAIPYLEIHHVISFGSNKNSDVFENLVKLCPACHKALTPYRADEELQKKIIGNILKNNPIVDEYLDNFLSANSNRKEKINFIYYNLK